MATDLRALALEQAELLSSRLKELLSAGQGYIKAQLGVDLGLEPEVFPTWAVLSTAVLGLLLLLLLLSSCGGLLAGKRRGAPATPAGCEPLKAPLLVQGAKPEEQKRNKKKPAEKKAQPNGRPVALPQEDVKGIEPVSKTPQETSIEKAPVEPAPAPAPVQVKKNKKKPKAEGKPARSVSATDGKEPDDGAWETKVSHREKKQQRRKDKGPDESGSPGGAEAPAAPPPTNARKNRELLHSRAAGKADAGGSAPASSGWREEPSVNGEGWADVPLKIPGPMEDKWSTVSTAPRRRTQAEPQSWGQETPATWSGMDGRMKTELSPAPFSMLGLKPTEPMSHSNSFLPWDSEPAVDDEWSGCSGTAAVDPSSDWSVPAEYWGNYEEEDVVETLGSLLVPASPCVSDEKESEDLAGAKSKKKKKKKKRAEEEGAAAAQVESSVTSISAAPKPPEVSAAASSKLREKSEQTSEPPKSSQKKKVRRET